MSSTRKARTEKYPHGVTLSWLPAKGRWRIRWRDPRTGERQELQRKDEADARAEAEAVSVELSLEVGIDRGDGVTRGDVIVDDFIRDVYLTTFAEKRGWKASTVDLRRVVLARWVSSAFGHLAWDDVTAQHVEDLLESTVGLSGEYRKSIRLAVGTLLEAARRSGCIEAGWRPLDTVELTADNATVEHGLSSDFVDHADIPDPDAIEQVALELAEAGRPDLGLMVRLTAYSGLRYGEVAALTPEAFDWTRNVIRVSTAFSWLRDGTLEVGPPKMGKRRVTVFPDWLAAPLKERALEVGPDGLMFPNADGGPMRHQSFYYYWNPARAAALWPRNPDRPDSKWAFRWSFHSLRHHFCTWALAPKPEGRGIEIADVAFFAGHSSVRTTMDRYVDTRGGAVERFHSGGHAKPVRGMPATARVL